MASSTYLGQIRPGRRATSASFVQHPLSATAPSQTLNGAPARNLPNTAQSQYTPFIGTGFQLEAGPLMNPLVQNGAFSYDAVNTFHSLSTGNTDMFGVYNIPQDLSAFQNGMSMAPQTNLGFNQGVSSGAQMDRFGVFCYPSVYPANMGMLNLPQPVAQHEAFERDTQSRMSAAPTTRNEKRADTTGLNIVMVDPSTRSQRENRVRSDKDLQKQQESKLLKELGGACLWCYRNKKKCDPSDPCPSCASNGYKCIRESTQLCVHHCR